MSTNAKLALAIGIVLALGAGGFILLRDEVHVGAMSQGAAMEHGPGAPPERQAVALPKAAPEEKEALLARAALYRIAGNLSPRELRVLQRLKGVDEVQPFLLVTKKQGGPAQGIGPGARVLAFAGGRALVPPLLWGRLSPRGPSSAPRSRSPAAAGPRGTSPPPATSSAGWATRRRCGCGESTSPCSASSRRAARPTMPS